MNFTTVVYGTLICMIKDFQSVFSVKLAYFSVKLKKLNIDFFQIIVVLCCSHRYSHLIRITFTINGNYFILFLQMCVLEDNTGYH